MDVCIPDYVFFGVVSSRWQGLIADCSIVVFFVFDGLCCHSVMLNCFYVKLEIVGLINSIDELLEY